MRDNLNNGRLGVNLGFASLMLSYNEYRSNLKRGQTNALFKSTSGDLLIAEYSLFMLNAYAHLFERDDYDYDYDYDYEDDEEDEDEPLEDPKVTSCYDGIKFVGHLLRDQASFSDAQKFLYRRCAQYRRHPQVACEALLNNLLAQAGRSSQTLLLPGKTETSKKLGLKDQLMMAGAIPIFYQEIFPAVVESFDTVLSMQPGDI